MFLVNALRRLYAPEHLIRGQWLGAPYTTQEVYRTLMRIAWPAMLESVLIGMITFVDTLMISGCGPAAIAAVGLTNQPRQVFFAVFTALNIGVTAIVSRRRGQDDREGANRVLAQALSICSVLSVILCVIAFVFARPILLFAGGQDDTIDTAVMYFKITMVGTIFTAFGMVINAAHRGCGNTKISMYTNLSANVVNLVFNWLLINGVWIFPRLEVKGDAISTLMGNVVSFLISAYSLTAKDGYLKVRLKNLFRIDQENLKLIMRIGSSAAAEQVFVRIGFFAYAKMVATLGTEALATHQICMSIINLSYTFGDGLSIAASALVGQNLGRKRSDMAAIYGKSTQRVGALISIGMFSVFMFGGGMLVGLFTDQQSIIDQGIKLLFIMAFASPAQISQIIFSGCLRGSGDTKYVAYASLISIGILRPIFTYVLCYTLNLGLIGAWLSLLIDQYLRLTFSASRFARGKWKSVEL